MKSESNLYKYLLSATIVCIFVSFMLIASGPEKSEICQACKTAFLPLLGQLFTLIGLIFLGGFIVELYHKRKGE